jgi:hypothetical protein
MADPATAPVEFRSKYDAWKPYYAWRQEQDKAPDWRPRGVVLRVWRLSGKLRLYDTPVVLSFDNFQCPACEGLPCKNPHVCSVCDAPDVPCCFNLFAIKQDACPTCSTYIGEVHRARQEDAYTRPGQFTAAARSLPLSREGAELC